MIVITTSGMMRDNYINNILNEEDRIKESENCICGYKLRRTDEYTNKQNQDVTIMICDSCGAIEHWVEFKN